MENEYIKKFMKEREKLNNIVMKYADIKIKRYYSLDSQAYRTESLSSKVKEMLGLVSSLVLRCDDCIKYHLIRCYEEGVTDKELEETITIGVVVGGTITIPHMRRAFEFWDKIKNNE